MLISISILKHHALVAITIVIILTRISETVLFTNLSAFRANSVTFNYIHTEPSGGVRAPKGSEVISLLTTTLLN